MPTLYVIATPIGNLEDISLRALRVLKECEIVLCEDTRQTKKLFQRHGITTQTLAYHQHSNDAQIERILNLLRDGKTIGLVTDAGTPGVSDPGGVLVDAVASTLGNEVSIVPIPGPSALTALISIAGLPCDRFTFYGFIPHKKGRAAMITEMVASERTVVFYESPHRIQKTIATLREQSEASRRIIIGRELTKAFETVYRGTIAEIAPQIASEKPRGEYVIMLEGKRHT